MPEPVTIPAPATLPEGERVYAVGDVHGQAEWLEVMLGLIRDHAAGRPGTLVFIGDLVDRGPDSRGAVQLARQGVPGLTTVHLMGNHERLMLDAVAGDRDAAALWLDNGGAQTLASWGVPRGTGPAMWSRFIPLEDLEFLRGFRTSWRSGGYLFAHAGVRPGIPIERQSPHDLMWIREPFLSWPEPLPLVVVHGHTPSERPEVKPHRIGIDTGAGWGRSLTCAVLVGGEVGFLQV